MSFTQDCLKESFEAEYVALATSLSPGVALAALINSNNSPAINKYIKEISVADIPMPISKDEQKNIDRMMNDLSVRSNTEKSQMSERKYTDKRMKEKSKDVTIKVKEEDPDIAAEKREKEMHDNRAIAIYDLFERKRVAYHDQGRIEIKKHLIQSKQRLEKLEKNLKLAGEKKPKVEAKKKVELPLHLQGGLNNNFKVDESMKSCWYDRVAENYLSKRRLPKKEKLKNNYINQVPIQHDQIVSRPTLSKKEEIGNVQKGLLDNIFGAPVMCSLNTQIEMNDDTSYYFTKYDYDFHSEKLKRKNKLKQISDQISRNKAVTLDSLVHNGINVIAPPVSEKVEEETILINIPDDDTLEETTDDKSLQRRQSLLRTKKSFSEKEERLTTRRSFLLSRNNSRRTNESDSDARISVGEDDIINIFFPQSPSSQSNNLSVIFKGKSPRKIDEKDAIKLPDFAISENTGSELHTNISKAADNQVTKVVEKSKVKKVPEPLTWNEMVEMDSQKIVAPEKVPLMKWYNPKFN